MEQQELNVQTRDSRGKGASRKLRAQDMVPAIFYGPYVKKAVSLAIPYKDLWRVVRGGKGAQLFTLRMPKDSSVDGKLAMVKSEAVDPVTHKLIHVDLYEVRMDEQVKVFVSIKLSGKPKGVADGGILEQVVREVEVKCLPNEIPDGIEVDVSELEIGHSIHLSEIELPKGVKVLSDVDYTLASVVAPMAEEEVVAEVPAEGEVAAAAVEGEAPPAEGAEAAPAEAKKEDTAKEKTAKEK